MTDIEKVNRRFKAHYYCHGKMEQCFDPPEFLLSKDPPRRAPAVVCGIHLLEHPLR